MPAHTTPIIRDKFWKSLTINMLPRTAVQQVENRYLLVMKVFHCSAFQRLMKTVWSRGKMLVEPRTLENSVVKMFITQVPIQQSWLSPNYFLAAPKTLGLKKVSR